jgi:hypothetical protein
MKRKPTARISLLFSKSTKGVARLSVPIQWTNGFQQYIHLHIICTEEEFGI